MIEIKLPKSSVAEHMSCDSVEDGLLPNGESYTWKMRRIS